MKCPKCNYTSFDYLTECKKCGQLLDEVKRRLNLQLSKPSSDIVETVNQEAESIGENPAIDEEKTDQINDQEEFLADAGKQEEEEVISSTGDSLPPLEGLGSMADLENEDSMAEEKNDIKFEPVLTEENQEIIAGFNPSDEQLEDLNFQEDYDLKEEISALDSKIPGDDVDKPEAYDHEKVIELTAEEQIFDLELELEDK